MANRQDNIKALITNGAESDLVTYLTEQAGRASADYAQIESDPRLSDDYRTHRLAVAAVQHRSTVDKEIERMASSVTRIDRDDAGRVFGTIGLDGDAASLAISRRDAGDRTSQINTTDELRQLLQRATRSGDEVLARACAERAVEMQAADIVNTFSDDRPHLTESVERVWNVERAAGNGDATLRVTMLMHGLRPAQLSGYSQAGIDQLADTEPAAQSPGTPLAPRTSLSPARIV